MMASSASGARRTRVPRRTGGTRGAPRVAPPPRRQRAADAARHRAREPWAPPARDERGTPSRALAKCPRRDTWKRFGARRFVPKNRATSARARRGFRLGGRLVLAKSSIVRSAGTHTRRARVPRRRRTGHASDRTRATPRGDCLSDPPRCRSGPTGTDPHADRARANLNSPRTDASPNDRVRRCEIPRGILLRPRARSLTPPQPYSSRPAAPSAWAPRTPPRARARTPCSRA